MVWLMSASRSSSGKNITFQLPRRSLMIAGIAFGVGVLLVLAVWLGNRNNDFYKAGPAQTPQEVAQVEPLPEPLPAAAGSSDIVRSALRYQSPPTYPPAALRNGVEGSVVVRVDVDATGYPMNVTIIQRSGSRDLDRAASDAVRRWRFQPAQSNGVAVPGSIEVPFDFKAQ